MIMKNSGQFIYRIDVRIAGGQQGDFRALNEHSLGLVPKWECQHTHLFDGVHTPNSDAETEGIIFLPGYFDLIDNWWARRGGEV